ncbi:hypothetical protein QBZ16_003829 [Prototheca wickerhamii]|uniref:Choline transporter-like protein n=1 Tax=Prototheca wickerhamii TaxID=3111 RepID=A0AAD9IGG9_PROWI|nr:hypothetical protein QBZ16_003829 [Prototheca wickerhamii]
MAVQGNGGDPGSAPTSLGPYQFVRTRKDAAWGVAYGACYLGIVLAGIYAAEEAPGFDLGSFMEHTARWLGASAALSLLLGLAFLKAFQHGPHLMTHATIVAQVVGPLLVGVALLGAGQGSVAVAPFALGALWLWLFWIVLSVVAIVPALFTLGALFTNGDVVPNPERELAAAGCVDELGHEVMCCAWAVRPWVQPAAGASLLVAGWTMLLANQVRVFVISGAVAQWYFSPAGSSTAGTTRRAFGHALGPSFGSLALGSLVLTVTETLRNAADRRNQDSQADILTCLFATVFMAITGDAFLTAGRRVTDLLVRNLLDTFASTIWFTPLVIQMAGLAMAGCWGCLSGFIYYLMHRGAGEAALGTNSAVLGALAGVISLFVLNFLGGVLLAVLDATFVCWALDKDAQELSQPEIAEILDSVPLKGHSVVEQPGGGFAYAGVPTDAPPRQTVVA